MGIQIGMYGIHSLSVCQFDRYRHLHRVFFYIVRNTCLLFVILYCLSCQILFICFIFYISWSVNKLSDSLVSFSTCGQYQTSKTRLLSYVLCWFYGSTSRSSTWSLLNSSPLLLTLFVPVHSLLSCFLYASIVLFRFQWSGQVVNLRCFNLVLWGFCTFAVFLCLILWVAVIIAGVDCVYSIKSHLPGLFAFSNLTLN